MIRLNWIQLKTNTEFNLDDQQLMMTKLFINFPNSIRDEVNSLGSVTNLILNVYFPFLSNHFYWLNTKLQTLFSLVSMLNIYVDLVRLTK